jgi:hypothetical protein
MAGVGHPEGGPDLNRPPPNPSALLALSESIALSNSRPAPNSFSQLPTLAGSRYDAPTSCILDACSSTVGSIEVADDVKAFVRPSLLFAVPPGVRVND